MIRVFTPSKSAKMAKELRSKGYKVTEINAKGRDGAVTISWCIIPRRKMTKVLAIIKDINPASYVTTDLANPMSLRK